MLYFFAFVISYLLGSLPMGLLLTRALGMGDLRKVGSGNIGATNVMRMGGLKLAGATWILDMTKAIAAVFFGNYLLGAEYGVWCGFVAIVGHCFPVWLRFQGGKGISSLFGVLIAVNPLAFIICGAEWLLVALSLGYSSLGAVVAFCVMPILGFAISLNTGFAFTAIALLCLWRHRVNVKKLLDGTESKIVWKWKK